MSVSRLLVLKVRPAWMRSMATAASVRRGMPDLAVKNVSADRRHKQSGWGVDAHKDYSLYDST